MTLNPDLKFTWLGHGTWQIRSAAGKKVLIDPWVMNNPVCPPALKEVSELDLMLITHGHFDHIWDAVEIAQRTRPRIVSIFEIGQFLASKGVAGAGDLAMNKGGTQIVDGIRVTMVHADHSCGIRDGDQILYGGEACGYVIEFENGFTVYFAGDTDVFGDMSLIASLDRLDAAFLPIGGHFTMGPQRAARAVELLGVKTVVPMHFGTFPALAGTPAELAKLVGEQVQVLDPKPGDTI
ncbi:MAG TPA: metal-dependent hydrolase [Candidatus Nitrosotalea sp.]|nr:metal-dependent hydrolase [Candidatus Nitrosotalea sp.]